MWKSMLFHLRSYLSWGIAAAKGIPVEQWGFPKTGGMLPPSLTGNRASPISRTGSNGCLQRRVPVLTRDPSLLQFD